MSTSPESCAVGSLFLQRSLVPIFQTLWLHSPNCQDPDKQIFSPANAKCLFLQGKKNKCVQNIKCNKENTAAEKRGRCVQQYYFGVCR